MTSFGAVIIPLETANVIYDFGDDVVAVQHDNGMVGIYNRDEDELMQLSSLQRNQTMSGVELAKHMFYGVNHE